MSGFRTILPPRPTLYLSSPDLDGPQRHARVRGRAGSFLWMTGRWLSTARAPDGPGACGYRVHNASDCGSSPAGCRSCLLGWFPHWVRGRGSMEDERRPRASAWQIAGVWIAAAALLLTAARMGLELWQMSGL
jgi:hypothetical protein